jgi:hypothetical protein
VSIFVRHLSESQGRIRTNRSTTLFDTGPVRPCCAIATSAAELTAGSGDSAKPKAASRTASLSDPLSAAAIEAWCSTGNAAAVLASSVLPEGPSNK